MSKSLSMSKTTPFSSTTLLLIGRGPDRSHKRSSKINRNHPVPNSRLLHRLRIALNKKSRRKPDKVL